MNEYKVLESFEQVDGAPESMPIQHTEGDTITLTDAQALQYADKVELIEADALADDETVVDTEETSEE